MKNDSILNAVFSVLNVCLFVVLFLLASSCFGQTSITFSKTLSKEQTKLLYNAELLKNLPYNVIVKPIKGSRAIIETKIQSNANENLLKFLSKNGRYELSLSTLLPSQKQLIVFVGKNKPMIEKRQIILYLPIKK